MWTPTVAPVRYRRRRLQRQGPDQVDRSAAYACRYVAKNIVAAGLARQCQIQVGLGAIGVAHPMNVTVYTEGTGVIPDERIAEIVREVFDLRPKGIIQMLDLRPIYEKPPPTVTSAAKSPPEFNWDAPTRSPSCATWQG